MNNTIALVVDKTALQATAVSTAALVFKMLLTLSKHGHTRILAGCRPPEDVSLFPKAGKQDFVGDAKMSESDSPKTKLAKMNEKRWTRIVLNDLENVPFGMIVSWGALLCNGNPTVHTYGTLLFAVSRILHTVFYAGEIQPHRAVAWFGAVVAMFGMSINALWGVSSL